MSNPNEFLKFLINEEIYLIDKDQDSASVHIIGEEEKELVPAVEQEPESETVEAVVPEVKNEILILFDNPSSEKLPTAEADYLSKILGAVGQSSDQVDFFNVAFRAPDASGYKRVIAFTPNHQLQLAAGAEQYNTLKLGATQVVTADSLSNISNSTDLRKKLWGVLQQAFGI